MTNAIYILYEYSFDVDNQVDVFFCVVKKSLINCLNQTST
jgi:hypothetical protein